MRWLLKVTARPCAGKGKRAVKVLRVKNTGIVKSMWKLARAYMRVHESTWEYMSVYELHTHIYI